MHGVTFFDLVLALATLVLAQKTLARLVTCPTHFSSPVTISARIKVVLVLFSRDNRPVGSLGGDLLNYEALKCRFD